MVGNDSISKTILVAFLVCLVCSIVVSGAAVVLKPEQVKNKQLDMQKNILAAAGLMEEGKSVEELFSTVEERIVDLRTGQFVNDISSIEGIASVATYDQRKATKIPAMSDQLASSDDIAGLKRKPHYAKVYLVRDPASNELQTLILPISGYGLWSTLYGFVALENDLNTVVGLGFYDHAETPGLGGEVDNPRWKSQWPGKKIYDVNGSVASKLKKGIVDPSIDVEKLHQVDGLAGATLTARGVTNLMQFWLGNNGFAPLLENIKQHGV